MITNTNSFNPNTLRQYLGDVALEWEKRYGVCPSITNAISEYDAAMLVGHNPESYSSACIGRTAVTRGTDFVHNEIRYQIKANRPSGKPGSFVTIVAKAGNYDWDILIWLLYDREFKLLEAWKWGVVEYEKRFDSQKRISPKDMRKGKNLFVEMK